MLFLWESNANTGINGLTDNFLGILAVHVRRKRERKREKARERERKIEKDRERTVEREIVI